MERPLFPAAFVPLEDLERYGRIEARGDGTFESLLRDVFEEEAYEVSLRFSGGCDVVRDAWRPDE